MPPEAPLICLVELSELVADRGPREVVRPASRQRLRLKVEVGDQIARDAMSGLPVEDGLHALRGEDRDRRQSARVRERCHGRLRSGADARHRHGGGVADEHDRRRRREPPRLETERRHAPEQGPDGADDRERAEHRDLGPELRLRRCDEQRCEQGDGGGVGHAGPATGRDRLRIRDHEEQEDEDLGRGDEHPPEVGARDRADVPARGHRVTGHREHTGRRSEREPEGDRDHEQVQAPEDREPAADDDREGEHHPRRHRPPPEVERLCTGRAEQEEAHDQADVRRVERMPTADADHVLREQPASRGQGVDPPPVQAPPVAVLRPGDAEHERDPVAGEHRARGPHQHVPTPEGDRHLEHGAGADRDQDLGDRQVEVERDLTEHLERDDHRGEVEPRIGQLRQQDRVGAAADDERRAAGGGCCGRAHRFRESYASCV